MTFALIFSATIVAVYIIICLLAGVVCGLYNCKKRKSYYSVSNEGSLARLTQHLTDYPEDACKIICINNLDDDELIVILTRLSDEYGFDII